MHRRSAGDKEQLPVLRQLVRVNSVSLKPGQTVPYARTDGGAHRLRLFVDLL